MTARDLDHANGTIQAVFPVPLPDNGSDLVQEHRERLWSCAASPFIVCFDLTK